jgi:lysophospholipase L1-like esterase
LTESNPAPGWAGARYVAMGSSFAAGPGIPSRVEGSPRAAGRSTGNYAHVLARKLGLDLVDVTFSGATTQEFVDGSAKRPAQVDAVTEATRLVTLTGGGNDVGFAPRILLSSLPGPLRALPPIRRQLASFADPELTEQRFTQLRENLLQLAAEVRKRAPQSQLLFVEYLTVLPPDGTTPTGVLPADVADWAAVSRPGWARPCSRPLRRPMRSSSPPVPSAPVITPGPPAPGRDGSTRPCTAGRPTIRTPRAWRR